MKYFVFLFLLILAACSAEQVPDQPVLVSEAGVNITGNSSIQIGQNLEVYVVSDSVIRIPQVTYYTKAGPWQIFRMQNGKWEEITFFKNCINFCEEVCTEQTYCAPGGAYPGCTRLREKFTFLKWDLRELQDSTQDCNGEELSCSQPSFVEPGKYKVVFSYRDTCESGVTWTLEESNIYKKEWQFEVLP